MAVLLSQFKEMSKEKKRRRGGAAEEKKHVREEDDDEDDESVEVERVSEVKEQRIFK